MFKLNVFSASFQIDTMNQNADREIGKHFLVTVRVYHPFRHKVGVHNNHPRCSQEIVVLEDQTLADLRDKILCPADMAVPGEVSENPDQSFTQRAAVSMKLS
jgi:hypothetical protein